MAKPLLFLISFYILMTASAKVLIATVAQVKNHVITSREVDIHARIDEVLGKRFENFAENNSEEQVIREWLLFFEASTFYNSKVNTSKKQKFFQLAKQRLAKSGNWKSLDVSDKELKSKIERRLEAERLYLFKKKASALPVSPSAIETEYTQNRIRYGNLKFEEVKDKIRKTILEKNLKKRTEQWFSVLERKYKVQRFSQFKRL